ncbi:hypothetical protein PAPHI01_2459 [Pancytospora philotis]|nr:hypothetical protein PAPHI01_2456 [Pancytospora philotis]KAI4293185.1 hypothetical protein PAPHI01_2459 [Pancytospora philotis]
MNKWKSGFEVVDLQPPGAFIVTSSMGSYRVNEHHIKKDFSGEEECRKCIVLV